MQAQLVPNVYDSSLGARESAQRLNVAIIDEALPYPLTSGNRIRTFNLIKRLAPRHTITYVCYRNPNETEHRQALDRFDKMGIDTVIVDRVVPPKSGWRFYVRLAANLLSPLPYSVAIHKSSAMTRALQQLAANKPFDLWQCEWTPYLQSMRGLGRAPQLAMAQNVESMIWKRYCDTEGGFARRWYVRRQWKKYERFEKRAAMQARCVVTVSQEDADIFRNELSAEHVDIVDNGVDTCFFTPGDRPRDEKCLLFLGSLDWRPNLDAVTQLLDRILPEVHKKDRDVAVRIVGRNPPGWLVQRANEQRGVELFANVPDVRPYLRQCSMLVVPLRAGSGSRLKILEALACGTPVVSTAIGKEGLRLRDGAHLTVVETAAEMAPAILSALRNPLELLKQTIAGREVVLKNYDWAALADRLERIWQTYARAPAL